MTTILVIDDEQSILDVVSHCLSGKYEVLTSCDPFSVIELLKKNQVSLVLLDINMPKMNGYQLCSEIRAQEEFKNLPILFLTAHNDSSTRTACYQVGGDNFIAKPFAYNEINAIVERHLKKDVSQVSSTLSYGDIVMNPLSHECHIQEVKLELPPKEYQLLLYFVQHPEMVSSREILLERVWKDHTEVSDRTIDTHISNLRKKIKTSQCQIKSIYQEGYIFTMLKR